MTKEQLEESVRSAASSFVTTTDLHLGKVQLNNPSVKFQASSYMFASPLFASISFYNFPANFRAFFFIFKLSPNRQLDSTFGYGKQPSTKTVTRINRSLGQKNHTSDNSGLKLFHEYTPPMRTRISELKQVLKACVQSTGREIPSKDIASIRTLKDIVVVMERLDLESQSRSANPKGHVVAEWFDKNKSSLPPNMVFIPYQKSRGVKAEDRKTTNKRFL